MEALTVQSFDNKWVIEIDKRQLPPEFMVKILKRLRIEMLAQKAGIDESILELANEMEENWWKLHGEEFLKGVKR
ncbi:MAG: hypothetical protein AAB316_01135 [Bacteroidota bacterium]